MTRRTRSQSAREAPPAETTSETAIPSETPPSDAASGDAPNAGEAAADLTIEAPVIEGVGEGTVTTVLPLAAAEETAEEADAAADAWDGEMGGRTIMVRSVSDRGRRRAGMAFGPVPQPVLVDDLTEEQLGGLLADPQLVVSLDD